MYTIYKAHALVSDQNEYLTKLEPLSDQKFKLDSLVLEPFYQIHDARYQMYFPLYTSKEYNDRSHEILRKEKEFLDKEAMTVDKINCGEQQPETDHSYKGEKSQNGYDDEVFWRNTQSYISYILSNKNRKGNIIEISTLDEIKMEKISIFINQNEVTNLTIEKNKLTIPLGNLPEEIQIKIQSKQNQFSPRFTEIRLSQIIR
jgi:hypothetical protein